MCLRAGDFGDDTMTPLPADLLRALADAGRTAGWNNRRATAQRFTLPGRFGEACIVFVVPARCWAYRRQERAASAYWRAQGHPEGTAA